jgi:hypothetical protein
MKYWAVARVNRKTSALVVSREQYMVGGTDFVGGPRIIQDKILGCLKLVFKGVSDDLF